MEPSALTAVYLPIALVLIMLGVGLDLRTEDFLRVAGRPRAAVIGTGCQIILVPLSGLAIASLFALPPELAVGIVIIAACPGGAVSNLVSYLARADVALSVTLTAISSLITVFTIPVIVNLALELFIGSGGIALPVLWTSVRLTALTIVPVVIGMIVRHRKPRLAARAEPWVRRGSMVVLAGVIVLAIGDHVDRIAHFVSLVGLPLLLLNGTTIALGWIAGRLGRIEDRQVVTLMIETGIQNGALGITIPALWISNEHMAIPPALYGVLMLVTGALIISISPARRSARVRARREPTRRFW